MSNNPRVGNVLSLVVSAVLTFDQAVAKAKTSSTNVPSFDLQPMLVSLTQQQARALFESRVKNRLVNKPTVKAYAAAMKLGSDHPKGWRKEAVWENPLKISPEGKMLAGQHRLAAQIYGNIPMQTYAISFNASEIARQFQDSNRKRTKIQEIDMFYDDPEWANISPQLRSTTAKLMHYSTYIVDLSEAPNMRNFPVECAAGLLKRYENVYSEMNTYLGEGDKQPRNSVLTKSAVVAALLFSYNIMDQGKWMAVFEGLKEGVVNTPDSAASKIRDVMSAYRKDNNETRWYAYMQCLEILRNEDLGTVANVVVDKDATWGDKDTPVAYDTEVIINYWK